MKAIMHTGYGPPEVALHLEEVTKPTPKDNEVPVDVDTSTILAPDLGTILILQIVCRVPSCFFELITGIWLLFRGVNIRSQDSLTPESA
jgi:hypothetical protein